MTASTTLPPVEPPDSDLTSIKHTRHYPLDLFSLPFDRYEHRHITARDVLVTRIMAAVMAPASRELAAALQVHRPVFAQDRSPRRHLAARVKHHHNFGFIKQHDAALACDIELLRKMLITRGEHEWIRDLDYVPVPSLDHRQSARLARPEPDFVHDPKAFTGGLTVEEEILDLVRRHYLETDDPTTRLWLQAIRPNQRSSYNNVASDTRKKGTYRLAVQERKIKDEQNARSDDKKWYKEDVERLQSLQGHARFAGQTRLYEGGAALPSLRQVLLQSKDSRVKFLNDTLRPKSMPRSFFSEDPMGQEAIYKVYPWPEVDAPRRLLHIPFYHSWLQRDEFVWEKRPILDLASGRTGRGLDRDGIWSTSRWAGDDLPRGRRARRGRRRAVSEPPPGLFTAARLPVNFNICRELLIFPKMTFSTMDRRSRRRSLSRTRIAEMFHWDTVLSTLPLAVPSDEQPGMTSAHHRQEEFHQDQQSFYKHLAKAFVTNEISIDDAKRAAWDRAPEWESRQPYAWPRWWRELEGSAGIPLMSMSHDPTAWMSIAAHMEQQLMRPGDAALQQDIWPLMAYLYVNIMHGQQRLLPRTGPSPAADKLEPLCANCASPGHATRWCSAPCGFCGAPTPRTVGRHVTPPDWYDQRVGDEDKDTTKANRHHNPHFAPECPVARQNRCRCAPFPQYHVAAKCPVLCSRDCGNHSHPPGHFQHKNAMGCKSRCCMCGMKGHSGTQCKLRRCRCGGPHLGQDCCFHAECRVPGCDRFLCGVHCQLCRLARSDLCEGALLERRICPACTGRQHPIAACGSAGGEAAEDTGVGAGQREDEQVYAADADVVESQRPTTSGRAKRKNKRKHRPDAAAPQPSPKPWYAPLAPRTRPVVLAKSGKNKWGWKADAVAADRIGGCR